MLEHNISQESLGKEMASFVHLQFENDSTESHIPPVLDWASLLVDNLKRGVAEFKFTVNRDIL